MKFKVGDVCEIVKTIFNHEFCGTECTVVEVGPLAYEVQSQGECHTRYAFGFQLKLKRPPSWDSWIFETKDVRREDEMSA